MNGLEKLHKSVLFLTCGNRSGSSGYSFGFFWRRLGEASAWFCDFQAEGSAGVQNNNWSPCGEKSIVINSRVANPIVT